MNRKIKKYGGLQMKKKAKRGISFWQAKYTFEAEQWVCLCIHDKQIPLLEWYSTANEKDEHQPMKLLDLLECSSVKICSKDDRCFIIEFVDARRPSLEFAARTKLEAVEWVQKLKKCLIKLNCLNDLIEEDQAAQQQPQQPPENFSSLSSIKIQCEEFPASPNPLDSSRLFALEAAPPSTTSSDEEELFPPLPPRMQR